eukprot:864191-Alexandrium_andersonii.AAC.1
MAVCVHGLVTTTRCSGVWVGGQGAELAWPIGLKLVLRPTRASSETVPTPVGHAGPPASGPV